MTVPPHPVAGRYTRPIYTPHNALTPVRSADLSMAIVMMVMVMAVMVSMTVRRGAAHENAACWGKLR
jgi:hypothetical protein